MSIWSISTPAIHKTSWNSTLLWP